MMFAIAAALLVTGGTLGTPWLTGLFSDDNHVSSANEAGVVCPAVLVGIVLVSDGEIEDRGDLLALECNYVLPPATEESASVTVIWTENGPVDVLQRGCGLPPSTSPGVFKVEGSNYGAQGQSRADYMGQTRYANAMRKLASDLAAAAASVAEPCPEQVIVTNPGLVDGGSDPSNDGSSSGSGTGSTGGSQGQPTGQGSSGSSGNPDGSGQQDGETQGSGSTGSGSSPGNQNDPEVVGTVVAPEDVPLGSCLVRGRITDSRGIAVPLIRLEIHDASNSFVTAASATDTGAFAFGQPVEATGRVVLVPTDGGRSEPVFRIFAEQSAVTLSRQLNVDEIEAGVCEVNFDIWNLDDSYAASDENTTRWPSIIELYQNFNRAADLSTSVGAPLDYGLPIPVYAWCDSSAFFCDPTGNAEFAFYAGSTVGREVEQPFVALGFPSSQIGYRGAPDNREYHEFGHAFFADVSSNQVPVNAGDQNHGGYYRNALTTDSFIEGFAEFYSVMVSKHIEQVENPQRYRIGAEYDIEVDRKPWEAVGWWEEFTLAGLLLDFEDGPEDYVSVNEGLDVESVSSLSAETGDFAIGRVRNMGAKVARNPEVTIDLLNAAGETVFTQVTSVKPESLGPGQTGVFYVAAPNGVQFSDVNATPGRPASSDDDDINLELADLMKVITSDWGAGPHRVTTVQELYDTLSNAFAGKDVDGDGVIDATQDQIDAIFLKHGFFDDLDGDRQWVAGTDGDIGGSAHPQATIARKEFPAIMPRSSAIGFAGSFVAVDTSGVDADLLVQVELADSGQSYAYWTNSGTNAAVELAVPGESADGATVTVIAAADGHEPAVAYRTTAQQFHAAVESGEITSEPVRASVQLQEGDVLALLGAPGGGVGGGSDRAGGPPWAVILTIALAVLMLGGGVYMMRRTGNVGARPGSD